MPQPRAPRCREFFIESAAWALDHDALTPPYGKLRLETYLRDRWAKAN